MLEHWFEVFRDVDHDVSPLFNHSSEKKTSLPNHYRHIYLFVNKKLPYFTLIDIYINIAEGEIKSQISTHRALVELQSS
jgi:hypothetical protein